MAVNEQMDAERKARLNGGEPRRAELRVQGPPPPIERMRALDHEGMVLVSNSDLVTWLVKVQRWAGEESADYGIIGFILGELLEFDAIPYAEAEDEG